NQYINEYRIKEIIKIMSDPAYKHMSIEEISEQGGFNSRSSFYKAFKDITGQTPSQFKSKTSS
ncbi:MAG: helix-turn-helix domain-containing protein, partial [Dysgonamonadaceae bacterium]|nr:helix-turn-helix domain-containing protein [Dysgonamonadaceae bacterium]